MTITQRRQATDPSETTFRLINYNSPYHSMRVGELFDYTSGQTQPLAKLEENAQQLELSALAPPDKTSEFVHSILYFGIKGNHVLICQSMSIRTKQMEDYFNWLLHETEVFGDDQYVVLADNPPVSTQTDLHTTKGIAFSSPVAFKARGERESKTRPDVDQDGTKSLSFKPSGLAWKALKSILPPEISIPSDLNADEIASGKELEVKLEVTWKGARKDDSSALLDTISNQLRHVDTELDYTIRTKSGATISKEEMKLKKALSVPVDDNGLPKREGSSGNFVANLLAV